MFPPKHRKMDKLSNYIKLVDTALVEIGKKSAGLDEAVQLAITSSGKRVRPVVSLLMCEVFCGDYSPALPIALTFELAHTASLVQDDIIDRSDKRRGKPSIYARFGIEKAILTSDMLIFEIFNQLAEYQRWNLSTKRIFTLLKLIGDSSQATTAGEDIQMNMTEKAMVTEQEYFEMVRKKTGALIAAPAASGAIVGGASEEGIDLAYTFGLKLGIAFQLQDDILDVLGNPKKIGKPIFKDLENNDKNIVIIHAMINASNPDRKYLVGLENKGPISPEDAEKARQILLKTGSIDYVMKLTAENYNASRTTLRKLKSCPARHRLLEITHMLSNRAQADAFLSFRQKSKLYDN